MEDHVKIEELATISKVLSTGGVILYPSDTIWGLGCDATNDQAIKRINKIKKRPADQPFLILVDSIEMLKRYTHKIHPKIETLLHYHERPLTLLYKQPMGVSPLLISEEQMIAIRVVKEGFCHEMISAFGAAIVSTSANVHGERYPKGFGSISSAIIRDVDYVVRSGDEEHATGTPSVMATFNHKGDLHFIRE